MTAGGGGSPVPRSGARAAMPEHGTRTRCIHGAWFRRGAGRARAPGRRWQGSSSQGRRRRGRARLAAAGHELSRLVETWLGNQHLAKSPHGLRAALKVPDGARGRRPAALSSRAPQLLFKGGEGSPSFSVPALRRRVGNSPGEILARRYAGADNSDTYRCRFLHGGVVSRRSRPHVGMAALALVGVTPVGMVRSG